MDGLREFDKRSRHFLLDDQLINSHNLISGQSMDMVRRKLMLVTIGTLRVKGHDLVRTVPYQGLLGQYPNLHTPMFSVYHTAKQSTLIPATRLSCQFDFVPIHVLI